MASQRTFKAKLLLLQVVAVLPLLIFIFYIFDLWFDMDRSAVLDNSINEGKLIASAVNEGLVSAGNVSNILANSADVKDRVKKGESLTDTLKSIAAIMPELGSVSLLDLSGKLLYYSQTLTAEQQAINFSDRDYFQTVISTKRLYVSDPLISRLRNVPSVVIASPMMDNGKLIAITASVYDLEVMKSKLESVLSKQSKSDILLFDKNNRLIFLLYHSLPTEEEKIAYNNLPFLIKNDNSKVNLLENVKLPNSDKLYLGASLPVNGFGWTVINLQATDEVFAPLYKLQSITWLILLVALLFTISLISYALRKIKLVY